MPDATIDTPEREVRDVPRDRPPVNNELPYHPFQQSEFPEGRGRCDSCGGGPDAPIHQKPIDAAEQLERIADALECLLDYFAGILSETGGQIDVRVIRGDE